MRKEGTVPHSPQEEKSERLEQLSIGFVFLDTDKAEKLAGLQRAQQLVLDFGGTIISQTTSESKTSKGVVTTIELIVSVPYRVTQLHHSFDSVLNNAETGCGAGWVTTTY